MGKNLVIILIYSFIQNLSAQDCETGKFKSFSPLSMESNTFSNKIITIAVTEVNQDVQTSIEKDLIKFRVDTLSLANKEMSKEGISQWYSNMVNLNNLAFQNIKQQGILDDTEAKRWAISIVNNIVAGWLTRAFSQTMHEKSHVEAASAAGATDTWYGTGGAYGKSTLGELFLSLLTSADRPSSHWKYNEEFSAIEKASIAAAGLNQQVTFTEKISDEAIKNGKFENAEAIHYLANKLSYNIYYFRDTTSELSDLKTYANSLADQGLIEKTEVNKTLGKVANYTLLSALMSGRTWDGIRANAAYIKDGKTNIDILSFETPIGKVTWPEFNTYLNSESVSIKGSSSVIKDNGNIHSVGIENSVIGRKSSEVTMGTYITDGGAYYAATARYNSENKYGAKLEVGYNIQNSKWSIFAGADIDNGTLEGKRRFFNLDGSTKTQYYLGVEYKN